MRILSAPRVSCVSQEIPEPLAGKGNRRLGGRIAKVEDAMKDLLASKEVGVASQIEEGSSFSDNLRGRDSFVQASVPHRPTSFIRGLPTPAETLNEYSLHSPIGAETTSFNPLWAAFPADDDIRMMSQESLRTSRYTYLINTQPHGNLHHETLGAPFLPLKSSGPDTHPVILAQRMLIFAITLQGPCEGFPGLSEPPGILSRRLTSAAVTWLSTQEETHSSVESLICIILEAVFETNCGNLRKAWVIYRRAMTIAQTMGLHRSPLPPLRRIDPTLEADAEFMWFRIVYMDRYLSILLGLPQGTADRSRSLSVLRHEPPLGQFERQLSAIASCILERNDHAFTTSEIITTQSMDEELLKVSKNMPASFWRPANFQNMVPGSPENLLETIRLAAQVYYYGLLIHLHLPSMMHGNSNSTDHEYSKMTCVNASREIITRFIAHRTFQPKFSCSRPVDFFALLASMTTLLAHLDTHSHWGTTNFLAHQRLSDLATLDQALERMDVIRDENRDIVMEDSGKFIRQLLEIEADAANGNSYTASSVGRDEDDEQSSAGKKHGELHLLIPYLGTIKITRRGSISREPLQKAGSSGQYQTPQTDFPYEESTRATLNDSPYRSELGEDNITLQSHLDFATFPDGMNDWAFQGVDLAFFDSLKGGYSGLDSWNT
ncbi:Dehydrocurvularin biosynthesis regulator [Lachnellula suecica]|uniref:Dehydrocurvularin biosynthesis regulator n=1 Tax=Lachnellula suecica TaxID=602035 RepID=A0A8T9BU09_9HELO|nr:Dehydrocurvularin biosynthesis regulator [Lachnellula suecica]